MHVDEKFCNLMEVRIKNFRGYGENVEREDGFFIFENLNSNFVLFNGFNGFGKTSFFDAIEWCLTDNVSRLGVLRRLYDYSTLANSQYFKFYSKHDNVTRKNDREIVVELIFDNDLKIIRKSKSKYLKEKEKTKYHSELLIIKDGNSSTGQDKIVDTFLINKNQNMDGFFLNSHFLGQENMNDFIRADKPEKRKEKLMQLLNLQDIQLLIDKSGKIKDSRAINNNIDTNNAKLNDINSFKVKIDNLLKTNNWGTLDDYISTLNIKYDELKALIKIDEYDDESILKNIKKYEKFTLNNCINNVKSLKLNKTSVDNELITLQGKKSSTLEKRENISKLLKLQYILDINKRIENLKYLQEENYADLINANKTAIDSNNMHKESENANKKKLEILLQYKFKGRSCFDTFFERLKPAIDFDKNEINETFWQKYFQELDLLKQILNNNKENIVENIDLFNNVISKIDIEKNNKSIKDLYEKYTTNINNLNSKIKEKRSLLSSLTKLNDNYNKVLNEVKRYIIENKEAINACPICMNDDFSDGKYKSLLITTINDKSKPDAIIHIIDHTITSENSDLKSITDEINKLSEDIKLVNKEIYEHVIKAIKMQSSIIIEGFEKLFTEIKTNLDKTLSLISNNIVLTDKICRETQNRINRFNESYKFIFENEGISIDNLQKESITELILLDIGKREEGMNSIKESLQLPYLPTIDEVIEKLEEIKRDFIDIEKYYPHNISLIENEMSQINNKIVNLNEIIGKLDEIVKKYELNDDIGNDINKIASDDKLLRNLEINIKRLVQYRNFSTQIYKNAINIQTAKFKELDMNKVLINRIYHQINPHPYFRNIELQLTDSGEIFIKDNEENVMLDHIFSAAQLNVLALSIFMGLGIPLQQSRLGQLFLDDPIQSMDDINILAFIDLLRSIMDSGCNKKLIVSTHDDNFAKLLSIKMRNRDIVKYNFVGYGREGPKIVRY